MVRIAQWVSMFCNIIGSVPDFPIGITNLYDVIYLFRTDFPSYALVPSRDENLATSSLIVGTSAITIFINERGAKTISLRPVCVCMFVCGLVARKWVL